MGGTSDTVWVPEVVHMHACVCVSMCVCVCVFMFSCVCMLITQHRAITPSLGGTQGTDGVRNELESPFNSFRFPPHPDENNLCSSMKMMLNSLIKAINSLVLHHGLPQLPSFKHGKVVFYYSATQSYCLCKTEVLWRKKRIQGLCRKVCFSLVVKSIKSPLRGAWLLSDQARS